MIGSFSGNDRNGSKRNKVVYCDYPGCGLIINSEKVLYDEAKREIYHFEKNCEVDKSTKENGIFKIYNIQIMNLEDALILLKTGSLKQSSKLEKESFN